MNASLQRINEKQEEHVKRKGKCVFTSSRLGYVAKAEDPDDVLMAFRKDQQLLKHLLSDSKGEERDSKMTMR